jgi:hypothetical protein
LNINDVARGIFIKSKDATHPVLLYLHGSMPNHYLTKKFPTGNALTLFNLIVAIGFLGMCIPIWKRLPLEFLLYASLILVMLLFRVNEGEPLVSYGRYAMAAFPVFMLVGK